jgi:acetyl-CoA acetyltransferase
VLAESSPLAGIDDTGIPTATELAARDAYETAGVGPKDVDLAECQDTDAARELLAWEELGLCEPGEQAAALDRFHWMNSSGGLLSKGEPLGASALGQVVWLVRRLRNGDGNVALSHVIGRGANAGVTILSR